MPDTKPSTLPGDPPDPALFGLPVNERPQIPWPEPVPRDTQRDRFVSEGATHVVIADHFGGSPGWERGDKISEADLPEGGHTIEELMRIKPYPPVRPLRDDERPKPEEVTKHHSKSAKANLFTGPDPKAREADLKAEADREADLKAEADREAREKALAQREKALADREKALAEKEAREKALAEKEAREKALAEKEAREKALAEKEAREKALAEKEAKEAPKK